MAMKDETRQYLATLARTYGLDEKALLKKAEEDEAAARFVEESTMLRSDYSRKQDELRTREQGLQGQFDTWKSDYYQKEVLPRWNQREEELKALQAQKTRLEAEALAYRNTYGTLEGFTPSPAAGGAPNGPVATAQGEWVSREQYQRDLQAQQQLSTFLAKEMTYLSSKHMKDFNEVLDTRAFEKFLDGRKGQYAGEDALRNAYADYVRPDLEKKAAAEREVEIARRVTEGVQAELAKRGTTLPYDNSNAPYRGSAIFRRPDEGTDEARLNDSSVSASEKEDILRADFAKNLGTVTASGILGGR